MEFDILLTKIGEFGKYQRMIYLLVCIMAIPTAINNMGMVFLAGTPDFWCDVPDTKNLSLSLPDFKRLTMPLKPGRDAKPDPCLYNVLDYGNLTTDKAISMIYNNETKDSETAKCNKWIYDYDLYGDTIVTDWNIVCDKQLLKPTATSVYMAGLMVGVVGCGALSDRYGRRKVLIGAVIMMVIGMVVESFSMNYVFFVIVRFLIGVANIGTFTTAFVLGVELVGPKWRVVVGVAIEFFWAGGYLALTAVAVLIKNWRWLQLSTAIPWIALVLYYFVLPESPRWLLTNGKKQEVEKLVRKMAKKNGVSIPEGEELDIDIKEEPKAYIWDLVRTPNMRWKSLNIFFNWFANSMVYYGLSLNTGNLGGDPYINSLISGAIEVPAYLFCIFALQYFGRKIPLCSCLIFGGVILLLTLPIPPEYATIAVVMSMLGKFAISASFAIIYVFAAELFPTVVRNVGVGTSSMFARIGGILSPYIANLGETVHTSVPLVIFGGVSLAAGLLALLLPETKDRPLPETLVDGEMFTRQTAKSMSSSGMSPDEFSSSPLYDSASSNEKANLSVDTLQMKLSAKEEAVVDNNNDQIKV